MSHTRKAVKSILRTEKSTMLAPYNKYLFLVEKNANKISIKKAVEEFYKVKVTSVNTKFARGKKKRVRYQQGQTPDKKMAIVTLKQGDKIDLT